MPTDPFPARQGWLDRKKQYAIANYPETWQRLVADWQDNSGQDALWLSYSANYLLHTAGIHWALDPLSLFTRVGQGTQPHFTEDLSPLQLIVLSHNHKDHFDQELLSDLCSLALTWIVPEFMLDTVNALCRLEKSRVIIPRTGMPLAFGPLVITPFNAQHSRGEHGMLEMGYLIEFSGKRWLFPGDTRSYDASALPQFGRLDGVFAHLWLGKAEALMSAPSLLKDFCQFFNTFDTGRIIISHLYEYGRDADNFWTMQHFRMVKKQLRQFSNRHTISPALMGQKIII